jgi:hypothetical protein
MKHLIAFCLAAALTAAAVFYSLKPMDEGMAKVPRRKLPIASAGRSEVRPNLPPSLVLRKDEESEANRLADDQRLPISERAGRLHEVLLRWAKRDLAAVTRWLLTAEANQERADWFSTLLIGLAESEPMGAFQHGLRLNQQHADTVVPTDTLLQISLKHLTADEAIQAMEQPKQRAGTISKNFEFHPNMDFQKLGDYLRNKAHHTDPAQQFPDASPANLVASWTRVNPAAAFEYAMAMNDVIQGSALGLDLIECLTTYTQQAPEPEALRILSDLLTTETVNVSTNEIAIRYSRAPLEQANLFFQAISSLPAEHRDMMGREALLMNLRDNGPAAETARSRAMQMFASPDARLAAAKLYISLSPDENARIHRHLQNLGHPKAEIGH